MEGLPTLFLQAMPDFMNTYMPMILMVIVIYFFFIRPQSQKQKAQLKFVEEMAKGDEIITTSGIFGKITKLDGDVVTLEVSPKTYIRVVKSAISKELTDETFKAAKKA